MNRQVRFDEFTAIVRSALLTEAGSALALHMRNQFKGTTMPGEQYQKE